ncbi:ABC-2 type transport system ATP-binding protein [Elusimicrobium posterum]|uniref:ABC transporter ATP-binding protein n=1 Tax=Elusimicrobium posterum TaxID=3116653 RepID=UPI003C793617
MKENGNIIEVENLTIAFGSFKAVDDISFDVKKGEIFGFLGANGAGKTTTIRTICGILNPTSGTVKVNGEDVSSSTAVLKPYIGYMSQKFTLYPDLTIKENIDFAGSLYNMEQSKIDARVKEIFDFINLETPQDSVVKNISGGIKQMVALGATLLHDPDLVFLDEPTAGTSPQTRVDFWNLIRDLSKQGKTIFVTTHYMDEAEYCNRIVLMDRGKIIAFDTPENLKKEYYPKPPVELVFKQPKQREIRQEFDELKIGTSAVFGNELRVNVDKPEEFEKFKQKHKDAFEVKDAQTTLEDVFLKALALRGYKE